MDTLQSVVVNLGHLKAALFSEAKLLFADLEGTVKPCDAMALSVAHRALLLQEGCIPLLEQKNLLAGVPLLRMQIDSFLRFTAVYRSQDPHGLAIRWLHGEPLSKIKGDDNQKMTDKHLLELFGNQTTKLMYEWACGHIHLSGTHFIHVLQASPTQPDGQRFFQIGPEIDSVSADQVLKWAVAQREAGAMVVYALNQWRERRKTIGLDEVKSIKNYKDLQSSDMEKIAKAAEFDAKQALPGLRESLAEAKAGVIGAVHTPEQIAAHKAGGKLTA